MKALILSLAGLAVVLAGVGRSEGQVPNVFNMPSGETSLQFVTVGNPGNAADTTVMNDGTTGYGSVPYVYQMGKYDVTLGQYTQFLNAVATTTDPYGVYNSQMSTDFPNHFGENIGISRSGSSGSYSYSVMGNGNMPVFDVTWGDAARFCNWLQNGQLTVAQAGLAITETGAYTLSGATSDAALMLVNRNAGAKYFIPSENEWYKAACYSPTLNGGAGGYWLYPTNSNTAPINVPSPSGTNNANFYDYYGTGNGGYTDSTNYLTPVGYFAGSPGPHGTFDMGGDVWQWNEANIGGSRGVRGGAFYRTSGTLASSDRDDSTPSNESISIGFRVASTPEPGSITLLVAGAAGLLAYGWRRRRVRRLAGTVIVALMVSLCILHLSVRATYAAPIWQSLDAPLGTDGTGVNTAAGNNIVGCYGNSSGPMGWGWHGFLYNGATWTTFDYPGALETAVLGINGTDLLGWYLDSSSRSNGFLYNGTTWTTLDFPGATATSMYGMSGNMFAGTYSSASGRNNGFQYDGATWTTIDYPGATGTNVLGIFGSSLYGYYDDSLGRHGFVYHAGQWTVINAPGSDWTIVDGFNGSDYVGEYETGSGGTSHGFLYDGTSWTTLDYPGALRTGVGGFSNDGLVGSYLDSSGVEHGFIVNNVPEPSSLALLAAGAAGVLAYSWGRPWFRRSFLLASEEINKLSRVPQFGKGGTR